MGRVIHTNSPTTVRNQHRRTIAELLRHLGQKGVVDDEAKDMAATIVLLLHEIDEGIQKSADSWEKRDYWLKSEQLLRDWEWSKESAANLDDLIRHDAWDLLPKLLMEIFPHFSDLKITKWMRKADSWEGNYAKLLTLPPLPPPY